MHEIVRKSELAGLNALQAADIIARDIEDHVGPLHEKPKLTDMIAGLIRGAAAIVDQEVNGDYLWIDTDNDMLIVTVNNADKIEYEIDLVSPL